MSEGADSVAQICGDLLTPLGNKDECDATAATTTTSTSATTTPSPPPPQLQPQPQPQPSTDTTSYTSRRPRFGTGGPPPSPYVWVDGRQLRSALAWTKKWPPRRVSFSSNDNHLVTSYLEPANPWRHAENVNHEDLIFSYKESCARHNTKPLQNVLVQLENLDISQDRCEELNLKGEILDQNHSEPLEEILKRIQFNKIDLEGTSLNDESSVILFDMVEYYESAKHLNISSNSEIGARGWQACSHMIKKTQCLEQFEARDITFNEQNMNILSRALRLACHLHVLKLENCGLSGRAIVILVTALKISSGIRELYLADNGLDLYDAVQLGSLLRMNNRLQLLDISNNNVQDDGVRDILEGLINQVNEDKTGKGLSILILWNNRLTKKSSPYISRIIALSKTLETLNIGQNMLTDETLSIINESLKKNRVLLQLGMQSTELTCDGIITLAEIMETNQVLQRIDLRDNSIQMRGMHALLNVMKKNKAITQIDLDDRPRIRIDSPLHQYKELVAEIRSCCNQNEERRLLEQSTEDAESPQHPSRLLNASSRKISLTCHTLPSPPSRSVTSLAANEPATCAMLEPKRTSGGRLRSPAPSPIPSPVASPIPSPSRNRFVVCRVPEASLRSADSSASSSPVTPSSLSSSPCFFPGASGGPSRFRVSVVESAGASQSLPKSVVASSSGSSVTIGFNVKVKAADSDDSDNVTKTETQATQTVSDNTTASVDMLNVVPVAKESSLSEDIIKNKSCDEETRCEKARSSEHRIKAQYEIDETVIMTCKNESNESTEVEKERLAQNNMIATLQSGTNESIARIQKDHCDKMENQSNVTMDFESVVTADRDTEAIGNHRIVYTSTKELQVPAYPNEDTASMRISVIEDKALIKSSLDDTSELYANQTTPEDLSTCVLEASVSTASETSSTTTDSHSQEQASTSVQRHKSSLEKLLSLFQHPGQFFSDSSSATADTRSSLQENVSGVMTLSDRLQQYLKEGRTKVSTDSSWSSEHGSPLKNKSVRLNVSQLQNLTTIFTSFKIEPHVSLVEHSTKFFGQVKNQGANVKEKDSERSVETEIARVDEKNSSDQEKNQVMRNDGKNSVGQEKSQVIRNGESNVFNQELNQVTKDDEKDLIGKEKNQGLIIRNDENDLSGQEKNQVVARNDEQKLFDQVIRDNKNLDAQEKNQVLNDENNLSYQIKDQVVKLDEKNLKDQENKQIARNINESFEGQEEIQIVQDNENLQGKDKVTIDEKHDLNDREKVFARNSEDLEYQNELARHNEKDSVDMQNACVNEEKGAYNVDKLHWTESDLSDQSLPRSVQSKDDFVDNLVLEGGCVATNAAISSSLANKSTVCIAIKLTDIPEYSALELSKADGTGCNDAKRFENFVSDDEHQGESNDAQDTKCIERIDAERLKRDVVEVLEDNDAKCVGCDDAVAGANALTAGRTCDTTTTDSINQTSDNSFPICNIAHDRKAVDSVSTASVSTGATTVNDVGTIASAPSNGGILSMSPDNVRASSTSLKDVDASDYLNEEVTSSTRCVAGQDHQCDIATREEEGEEDPEILDDACCDSADRRSTSVNIKVEPRESVTTSPGSQEAPEECRERQSFMPNNVNVHRTILKDMVETEDRTEDVVDDGRRIDPTILVTPYETSANLDKSDAEELIFCMTDISTDGTSMEDELSPGIASRNSPNDIVKVAESYFELPLSRTTPTTTLLIENPEGMHRNSQDSGIEETVLTIDDTVGTVDAPPLLPPRSSLQESVDSGIESECSSICIRVESGAERTLEVVAVPKRLSRDDNGACERDNGDGDGDGDGDGEDNEFGEFASDFLAREAQLVDNDSMSDDIAHSYLNNIKCAVVSTARPVAGIASSAPLRVIVADEGVACSAAPVIAHSPAAVHGTSPK